MARRNHIFAEHEYYHCFNRGTDKRTIFADKQDYSYFLSSMKAYNSTEVLGKLRLHSASDGEPLVDIAAYCLLPNHFHFVLRQNTENGISHFMQRLGIGYTMYFNEKNKRSGSLFQGAFKSRHITDDQALRQVTAYVALNYRIHNITDALLYRSSAVRDPNSNIVMNDTGSLDYTAALEIVDIIKAQRLEAD